MRHAREMGSDYCSSDGIFREGHMDIYTTKMQTTAPRDETRLGVGWQISGRAVASSDTITDTHAVCMAAGRRGGYMILLYCSALSSACRSVRSAWVGGACCFAITMLDV